MELGSRNAEVGKKEQETDDGMRKSEFGSRTRRRPKGMGLCRGKHAASGLSEL
jgi:hypothetical protein